MKRLFLAGACFAMSQLACIGPTGPRLPGTWMRWQLNVDGFRREAIVYVPSVKANPRAVIFAYHGLGGTGNDMEAISGFDGVAERNGAVVVYPDAFGGAWAMGCPRCTPADTLGVDDVHFSAILLDSIAKIATIDRKRVYAAGFSLGGYFAYAAGCRTGSPFAAVAAVSATMPRAIADLCTRVWAPAVLEMVGTADPLMPYGPAITLVGADSTIAFWRGKGQCTATPTETTTFDTYNDGTSVTSYTYSECMTGAEVVLYRIDGGGHIWPGLGGSGAGIGTQDISGEHEISLFFSRHALP